MSTNSWTYMHCLVGWCTRLRIVWKMSTDCWEYVRGLLDICLYSTWNFRYHRSSAIRICIFFNSADGLKDRNSRIVWQLYTDWWEIPRIDFKMSTCPWDEGRSSRDWCIYVQAWMIIFSNIILLFPWILGHYSKVLCNYVHGKLDICPAIGICPRFCGHIFKNTPDLDTCTCDWENMSTVLRT